MEKEFNLLDEPWLRVAAADCTVREVSLKELFAHAHEYTDLAGELPTQDIAVLRLLLAILHAVFSRVDADGEEAPLEDADTAYDRWTALWNAGRLPMRPIEAYLERWRERFWLFHPERPFYQVHEAKNGTEAGAKKLNGEISESNNKPRLFPCRSGTERDELEYAAAARWLLYINAFDDAAAKKSAAAKQQEKITGVKLETSVAWVGKLGILAAKGKDLFETLLLNLVLLDENEEPWPDGLTPWEREEPRTGERTRIPCPQSQIELLTLQSRRVLLKREGAKVVGYTLLGGDLFDKENALTEQMTLWSRNKEGQYCPRAHQRSRRLWQDFGSLAGAEDGARQPGAAVWGTRLRAEGCLNRDLLTYRTVAARYDSAQSSSVTDTFEDTITFRHSLLAEVGCIWLRRITDEINSCEALAKRVGWLAREIDLAAGGSGENGTEAAKEQFYYRIDRPFRSWLEGLDAADTEREAKIRLWRGTAARLARELGEQLVQQAGPAAYRGRLVKKNEKDKGHFYTAPDAYRRFLQDVSQYEEKGEINHGKAKP